MDTIFAQAFRNFSLQSFLEVAQIVDSNNLEANGLSVLRSQERDIHFFVTHLALTAADNSVNVDLAMFIVPITGGGLFPFPLSGAIPDISGPIFFYGAVNTGGPNIAFYNPPIIIPQGYEIRLYKSTASVEGLFKICFKGWSMVNHGL